MMNKDANLMKGYLNTGRAEKDRDGGRDAGAAGDDSNCNLLEAPGLRVGECRNIFPPRALQLAIKEFSGICRY
jgi:hypothetical protein